MAINTSTEARNEEARQGEIDTQALGGLDEGAIVVKAKDNSCEAEEAMARVSRDSKRLRCLPDKVVLMLGPVMAAEVSKLFRQRHDS